MCKKAGIRSFSFYNRVSNSGYRHWKMYINGIEVGDSSLYYPATGGTGNNTVKTTGTVQVKNAVEDITGSITVLLKLYDHDAAYPNGNAQGTFRMDDFILNGYINDDGGSTANGYQYANRGGYRYGFNGQEKSDEIKGEGNSYTALYWEYDSRIGRRWNVDPKPNISISQYVAFLNNPIAHFDVYGDTPINKINAIQNGRVNYSAWNGLLLNAPSKNLLSQANNRFFSQSFKDQKLSQADGQFINLDYYEISISKLPPQFKDAGQLFENIRVNFATFINPSPLSTLEPYDAGEKLLWKSSNPNSSIMRFKGYVEGVNLDDADVITMNYNKTSTGGSWQFRPISNLNILNPIWGGDKGHPLAGTREFGIAQSNNNYIFYIQGIDRMWNVLDVIVTNKKDGYFFKQANEMWQSVMGRITTYINEIGGKAIFDKSSSISTRIDYQNSIKIDDRKKIEVAGN